LGDSRTGQAQKVLSQTLGEEKRRSDRQKKKAKGGGEPQHVHKGRRQKATSFTFDLISLTYQFINRGEAALVFQGASGAGRKGKRLGSAERRKLTRKVIEREGTRISRGESRIQTTATRNYLSQYRTRASHLTPEEKNLREF